MGVVDNSILQNINTEIKKFCKENKLPFSFKTDDGTYETAIEFTEIGYHHPPKAKNWDSNPNIFCPDLIDYPNHTIIEYEEEGGKRRSGARIATKGHGREFDLQNKKDIERDYWYEIGGFRVLKIWEHDYKNGTWKQKLHDFLN